MQKKFSKNGKKNTEYKIKLTEDFLEEIEEIYKYISNTLKAKSTAKRLIRKVINNIHLVEKLPEIFMKIEKYSKTERQYRRFVVNNYVVLYTVDNTEKIVYIVHIYYGRRNYINDLL